MFTLNELMAAPAKALARPRNIFWDTLFYDIGNLSAQELEDLSVAPDKEGAVIVVSPAKSGKLIRHYSDAKSMLKTERLTVAAVAVPGVGSSIVGAASLARTIADTMDADVAAIVCGYGATDLLQEAMGGWFFYGYTDKLKHRAEAAMERVAAFSPAAAWATGQGVGTMEASTRLGLPRQLDTGALAAILEDSPPKLKLLLGHSKGSMLIDFVLEEFVARPNGDKSALYEELTVVTVSAVVSLPRQFKRRHQLIGSLDWFGGINSVPDLLSSQIQGVKPTMVPASWHHLNSKFPFSLDLGSELRKMLGHS